MTPQTMSGVFAGIGIGGSVISGLGQYESGQKQQDAYNYNADVTLANMRSKMQSNQQQYTELVGRQASAYAASGVDIASGSPLLIMAATAARGGQQGEQIREQGTQESNLQRYYGKIAAWSGTMNGIGSFLSGMSKSASDFYQVNAPTPTPSSGSQTLAPYPA